MRKELNKRVSGHIKRSHASREQFKINVENAKLSCCYDRMMTVYAYTSSHITHTAHTFVRNK